MNDERSFASLASLRYMVVAELHFNLLLYATIVALSHFMNHYRQKRARELTAAQLEADLVHAQLETLRLQLCPHFLFNTLNTISVLIGKDTTAARQTVERLSDLLRALLKHSETHEVTLSEELELIKSYLEIERTRFPDRLYVQIEVDPKTLDAQVPTLILQPIVENALKYGINPIPSPTRVKIRTESFHGCVRLQVSDDGPGPAANAQINSGARIGLTNTRARLERMYGDTASLELSETPGGGTLVSILIPFHSLTRSNRFLEEPARTIKIEWNEFEP